MKRTFTDTQAKEVLQRLAVGETAVALAQEFGVTAATIRNLRRRGYVSNPQRPGPKSRDAIERLWDHIERGDPKACWLWNGASRNGQSYPTIGVGEDKVALASHVMFESEHRVLQPGEMVLHTCRAPLCMNPSHLYAGSKDDWGRQLQHAELSGDERELRRLQSNQRSRQYYQDNSVKARRSAAVIQTERKLKAMAILGGRCQSCGENHPAACQFHHRDPTTKSFGVSTKTLASSDKYPWPVIEREVAKCDLLCSNCHAKHHSVLTNLDGQWVVDDNKIKEFA
jgi:hypothetical protein